MQESGGKPAFLTENCKVVAVLPLIEMKPSLVRPGTELSRRVGRHIDRLTSLSYVRLSSGFGI